MIGASAAGAAEIASPALGNIFLQGEPISLTVRDNATNARWLVRDFFGNEVASGSQAVARETATLHPQIPKLGYFTLDISLEKKGAAAEQVQTSITILPPPPTAARNSPFGVVTHFAKDWPTDIIPLIAKAGIGKVRDEQPWRKVERQHGQYQFPPRLSGFMQALAQASIDPLIVLVFSNPIYDNDKTPFSDDGRAGYAAYARAIAQHYRGQVSAVEVWNEYNGSFCAGPCRGDRPATYSAMLKQTYRTLKASDPALTVAGGAGVPIPLDFFEGQFRNGALDAMDAIVIHPYRKVPEGVEEKIADLRDLMKRYGKVKPVWVTEFSDLPDMRKSRDDVARYLVRMSTLLLTAGTERIYWYLLKDYQEFRGLGLLRSEDDPAGRYAATPAYAAYATLIRQLDGARFVRRETSDAQARVYLFNRGGKDIRVAWSMSGSRTFEIRGASVRMVDMMGNASPLTPQNGMIQVRLDQNPIYLSN
jgi:hypothetical protein